MNKILNQNMTLYFCAVELGFRNDKQLFTKCKGTLKEIEKAPGWAAQLGSVIPICQSCRFSPCSVHIQELINGCMHKYVEQQVNISLSTQ